MVAKLDELVWFLGRNDCSKFCCIVVELVFFYKTKKIPPQKKTIVSFITIRPASGSNPSLPLSTHALHQTKPFPCSPQEYAR